MSVLTATKSTWAMPASIIRLTALRPPPPTPTTRITARYDARLAADVESGAPSGIGWMKRLAGGSYGGSGRQPDGTRGGCCRRRRAAARRRQARGTRQPATGGRNGEIVDVLDRLLERGFLAPARRRRSRHHVLDRLLERSFLPARAARSTAPQARPAARRGSASAGRPPRRRRQRLVDGLVSSACAERPRSRGTARRAAPHACSRASAPWSTSFARSRYASAAVPVGSYPSTELPFTGASA